MRRYIILTNIALLVLFIFLSIKGYNEARELVLIKQGNLGIEENMDYNQEKEGLPGSFIAGIGHSYDYYNVIPEKDLFRPERKEHESPLPVEPEEENGEVVLEDEIRPPAVDLYGIMIEGQRKTALLFDKREKDTKLQYKVVSQGTDIQDFKVIRIEPERLIFEKNGQKAILELSHDKQARGGFMSVGSAKSPKVVTTKAKETKGKDSKLAVSVESSEKSDSKVSSTKKTSSKGKEDDNAEIQIIDTPFGKVKRKVKK